MNYILFLQLNIMSSNRKEYVTKQQKEEFIQWYLSHYGYNTNLKNNNSRVVSEAYQREVGILIPKLTIYRWLQKLDYKKVLDYSRQFLTLADRTFQINSQASDTQETNHQEHQVNNSQHTDPQADVEQQL